MDSALQKTRIRNRIQVYLRATFNDTRRFFHESVLVLKKSYYFRSTDSCPSFKSHGQNNILSEKQYTKPYYDIQFPYSL